MRFITELRTGSIIKDDAIPMLLGAENEPTFVTINETDFWRHVPISSKFCVVCFAFPLSQAGNIPSALQRLLRNACFLSKAQRMGCVIRVTANEAMHYRVADATVRSLNDW